MRRRAQIELLDGHVVLWEFEDRGHLELVAQTIGGNAIVTLNEAQTLGLIAELQAWLESRKP